MRSSAASYIWIWPLIMLIRILIRSAQNTERETPETTVANAAAGEPDKEKEKMTPTYMPPPREAGDGSGSKPKGDRK